MTGENSKTNFWNFEYVQGLVKNVKLDVTAHKVVFKTGCKNLFYEVYMYSIIHTLYI